jgi:hypothetical protein
MTTTVMEDHLRQMLLPEDEFDQSDTQRQI